MLPCLARLFPARLCPRAGRWGGLCPGRRSLPAVPAPARAAGGRCLAGSSAGLLSPLAGAIGAPFPGAPPAPLPSPPLRSALPGGGCALSFGKLRAATVAGAGRAGAWKATAAGAERRCSVEEAGCVGEGGGCRGVSEGGKPLPCGERVTGSPALPPAAGTLGAVEPGRLAGCLEHEVPAVQRLNAGAGGWGPEVLHPNSEQDSHVMWWPSMSPPGPWC